MSPTVPPLPGDGARPLEGNDLLAWMAVQQRFRDLGDALTSGDRDGARAALAAATTVAIDHDRIVDALQVPDDAGEHAAGLERILRRIPDGWGRWIRCGPGWYPLLVDLDEALAAVEPGYLVHQVKQKFGRLRYYYSLPDLACCQAVADATDAALGDRPGPDAPDRPAWDAARTEAWQAAFAAHDDDPAHRDAAARRRSNRAAMDRLVDAAATVAARTCERTGAPGVLMRNRHGFLATLDPVTAPDGFHVTDLAVDRSWLRFHVDRADGDPDRLRDLVAQLADDHDHLARTVGRLAGKLRDRDS